MDMMLIAIAAVVIIAIIAGVVMMKKKNTSSSPAPASKPSNRPKTLAEQQEARELQAQQAPAPTMPTPVDSLITAQDLVDKKDYPTAITTLKSAISTQPNRSDLQLLLLNIYAQQNNHADFNQQYTALMQLNDPAASAQATKLKALIDEEQAFQQAKSAPNVAVPVLAAAAATTVAATTAISSSAKSATPDTIDFDDFAAFQEESKPAIADVPEVKAPPVEEELAFDFDLDTDFSNNDAASIKSEPTATATLAMEEENDLSFDFDEPTQTPSAKFEPAMGFTQPAKVIEPALSTHSHKVDSLSHDSLDDNSLDDDSFDFDDIDLELPVITPAETVTAPVVATSVKTAENTTALTSENTDFSDFDLSFDEPSTTTSNSPSPSLSVNDTAPVAEVSMPASTVPAEKDDGFTLGDDDFNFDLDDISSDVAEVPAPSSLLSAPVSPSHDTIMPEPTLPEPQADSASQLDTLYAHTSPELEVSEAPSAMPELSVSAPVVAATIAAPALAASVLPTPSAPVEIQDFSKAFEAIQDLDHHQVTLELAEQYIQLGEYDSAKRLLNEVSKDSPSHQQTAKQLLASIE